MPVDITATLAELVTEDSRRSRVLEQYGLDFCCSGERTLAEATADAGLDAGTVSEALDLPGATSVPTSQPAMNAALAHDIVDTHHAFMWEEMPRLQALVDKVHGVHGARHPELATVREAYTRAVTELDPHMTREERSVFPAISRLEKGRPSGSLAPSIEQLVDEHRVVGDLFKEINSLTGGYTAPDDACASYRLMLQGLRAMELDLHEHIHKENNVLFQRVLAMEEELSAANGGTTPSGPSLTLAN